MPNLPLTTIELVSTYAPVPLNGSPSSQDYNDAQHEHLVDLSAIASFINGTLIPLLDVLPAIAAAHGLEGRAINTDSSDLTALCFNPQNSTSLTLAQSLKYLASQIQSIQGQQTDIGTQVAVLSSKLSSTNQNDIALTLQNFQTSMNALVAQVVALQTQVTTLAAGGSGGGGGGTGVNQAFQYVNSTPTTDIDFSVSVNWKVTLQGASTLNLENAPAGPQLTLIVTQNGTGGYPVVWPSNADGVPQPGTNPNASTVYEFTYDGVNYILSNSPIVSG